MTSQEESALTAQVEQVRGQLQGLAAELRIVDAELDGLATQRTHHQLLDQACGSLEKLGELGVASLFWGAQLEAARAAEHLGKVRERVGAFQAQIGALDSRRQEILDRISQAEESLELLGEDLYQAREQEERRKLEWVVEREVSPVPRRVQVMAWARGNDDDRRFRKALAASLAASLLLGALLPMIDLPLPKRFQAADVPKRLAQLVREEQAKPLPPPPVVEESPPEETRPQDPKTKPVQESKPTEQRKDQPKDTPAFAAADQPPGAPQKKAEKAGILAFRDKFAGLAQDKTTPRLGKDARFSDAEDASSEPTTRSMLTSNAPGSSGGINLASLSRNAGGGGSGGGGGCFIATAAYGNIMHPYVKVLREFRDRHLLTNSFGKAFVNFYYKYSPPIAGFIKNRTYLQFITRIFLMPLILFVVYPYSSTVILITLIIMVRYYFKSVKQSV